jgi:PilZ domain
MLLSGQSMPTQEATPRDLRTAERFLLSPPIAATFGTVEVSVNDLSVRGARFQHKKPLESGTKSPLKLKVDGRPAPVALEAVIIWTQAEGSSSKFVSGVRTYGRQELVDGLLTELQKNSRASRIEEMRNADRFMLSPSVSGEFGGRRVMIDDLSARGARVQLDEDIAVGEKSILKFRVPDSTFSVEVAAQVVWRRLRSISGANQNRYSAGLAVSDHPEMIRLAIGRLCELNRGSLDTHSLQLKLKIMRARARQNAVMVGDSKEIGVPAEQFLLVQGVREELRLNPEEAMYWYRKARFAISDAATRAACPPIADHPDAIAVWEYLDRSIDPSIIGRAFEWVDRR